MRKDATKKFLFKKDSKVVEMNSFFIDDFFEKKSCDAINLKNILNTNRIEGQKRIDCYSDGDKLKINIFKKNQSIELDMIFCSGGIFQSRFYGTFKESKSKRYEKIDRIPSFFLSSTEITQEIYELVIGCNPSYHQISNRMYKVFSKIGKINTSKHPIENVSWYDAIHFCNQLSLLYGIDPYYKIEKNDSNNMSVKILGGIGYRLPTSKEWMYVYMLPEKGQEIEDCAWIPKNSQLETHSVATKKPNKLGIYDMNGNVSEWCDGGIHQIFGSSFRSDAMVEICTLSTKTNAIGFRIARYTNKMVLERVDQDAFVL